jgi:hypothetical protein
MSEMTWLLPCCSGNHNRRKVLFTNGLGLTSVSIAHVLAERRLQ